MKKSIIGLIVIALMVGSFPAMATESCTVSMPSECKKIIDSEFSTGGGKKLMWIIEVGCEVPGEELRYKKFVTSRFAPTGFAGALISRWFVPKTIIFKTDANLASMKMSCD